MAFRGLREDDRELHRLALTVPDDWRRCTESDIDLLPRAVRTHEAVLLAQAILSQTREETTRIVLTELELLCEAGVDMDTLRSSLCAAPLVEPSRAEIVANTAASMLVLATAHIFSQVAESQPHLRRLHDAWMRIPPRVILASGHDRTELWRALIESKVLLKIIPAANDRDGRLLERAWNQILFYLNPSSPARRVGLAEVGRTLARELGLRHAADFQSHYQADTHDDLGAAERSKKPRVSGALHLTRVLAQIDAIVKQVGQGNDLKARQFLDRLVLEQRDLPDNLAKSLCNIAQRCKEIFRYDFERHCLEIALAASRGDSWTLIQWGNHLKDCRAFVEAREVFEQARAIATDFTPDHCLADLLASEGQLELALAAYRTMPDRYESELVETAVGDILRRLGRYDEALMQYDHVRKQWPMSHRARAGIAEVHHATGNLAKALRIYEELADLAAGTSDECHYLLMQVTLLRNTARSQEAFAVLKQILKRWPFNPIARYLKNSLLILAGKYSELDRDLPGASAFAGFDDWRRAFNRGLMLLCTRQLDDARKELLGAVQAAGKLGPENSILALAAANALLQTSRFREARDMVERVELLNLGDARSLHLQLVLQFHIAHLMHDHAIAEKVRARLTSPGGEIDAAVRYIESGDHKRALAVELQLFAACA